MKRISAMSLHTTLRAYKIREKALDASIQSVSGIVDLARKTVRTLSRSKIAASLPSHLLLEISLPVDVLPNDMRTFLSRHLLLKC